MKARLITGCVVVLFILNGCGSSSDDCAPLLLDPSGTWAGSLVNSSDTCVGEEAGAPVLAARHDIFTECNSEDDSLVMVDQDGNSYENTSYNTVFDFEFDFFHEDRSSDREVSTTVEYRDVTSSSADVTITVRRTDAERADCETRYVGTMTN